MLISDALGVNVERQGESPAVIYGGTTQCWSAWADHITRVASILQTMGVKAGDRVAILSDNSAAYLTEFFAIPWAGGIILPLNIRLSPVEIAYIIDHCQPAIILFEASYAQLLMDALSHSKHKPLTHNIAVVEDQASTATGINMVPRQGSDPASLFYTGGTTGRAKGVIMTHDNHVINAHALWEGLGIDTSNARYLHVAPMFHVADALFVHAMTVAGGCHVIIPRFDPIETMRAIQEHRITDTILVPTMIQTLLDSPDRGQFDLSSLKRIYYGAMPMPEAIARRLIDALPNCGLVQLYGQTEAGPVITMLKPEDHDISGATRHLRSAGTPLPGVEIAIMGAQGNILPTGQIGEILARSKGIMPGYWQDEEQSSQALQNGWLHTGDGGHIDDDGFLYIADRVKDMIISGGENVYSIEVERAITLYPGVSQCAVIGLPDPRWGEIVHAIVVPQGDVQISEQELLTHCRSHIAGYKCPRSISWRKSPLPLSGAGKVLKRELREEALRNLADA